MEMKSGEFSSVIAPSDGFSAAKSHWRSNGQRGWEVLYLTMGYDHLGQFPPNEMDGMYQ